MQPDFEMKPRLYLFFFSQLTHWASDRQELAAEWANLPAQPTVISDSTPNYNQLSRHVLLKTLPAQSKLYRLGY